MQSHLPVLIVQTSLASIQSESDLQTNRKKVLNCDYAIEDFEIILTVRLNEMGTIVIL